MIKSGSVNAVQREELISVAGTNKDKFKCALLDVRGTTGLLGEKNKGLEFIIKGRAPRRYVYSFLVIFLQG
jgi:hypothetical protein